jgi:hypothetical protein
MKAIDLLFLGSLVLEPAEAACSVSCSADRFKDVLPPTASIISAVRVANGSAYGEGKADVAYPTNPTSLPELCAVTVNVSSSSMSNYRFGLFLPTAWNSRFLAVGNGGFSGGINWLDMGAGVRYGHAVVSTDTGHNSTSGDLTWSLDNPERKKDFGYRAIHGSVELGKKMVEAFYGEKIAYSYYNGASTGGRQGLKEAQISPDSFDGMIIGAPAWWTSHLQTWTTKVAMYNLPASDPKHVPAQLFTTIAQEVVKQCDDADGIADGIVSYPDHCSFNVSTLLCSESGANSSACLTPVQMATVQNFYADYKPEGKFAFPGMEVGSEPQWPFLLGGSEPSTLGYGYVQYFMYDDPDWNWPQFNDSIVWEADAADPGDATADDYDSLAKFRDRGGRIFLYHGLADALIPPGSSYVFYDKVAAALGGVEALQEWFRFFHVPGMQHVTGTAVDAPWYFAGSGAAGALGTNVYSTPGFEDREHDAMLALMAWVEKGIPIDQIVATTWRQQTVPGSGVLRQRPLCPYPKKQTYDGKGDPDKPESFSCE